MTPPLDVAAFEFVTSGANERIRRHHRRRGHRRRQPRRGDRGAAADPDHRGRGALRLSFDGRSAAFYLESYGGPQVARLTPASHDFLKSPPAISPIADSSARAATFISAAARSPEFPPAVETRIVDRAELEQLFPASGRSGARALFEPSCADIDVAALHAAYLRRFRRVGGDLATNARLESATARRPMAVQLADGSTLTAHPRQCRRGVGGRRRRACGVGAAGHRAEAPDDGPAPGRPIGPQGPAAGRRRRRHILLQGRGRSDVWLSPHDEIAPIRAMQRPRRSTSRPRSIGSKAWSIGRSKRSSAAGRASGASRPTGCRSTASTAGRVLLVCRAGRLRHPDLARSREDGGRAAAGRGAGPDGRGHRSRGFSPARFAALR